MKRNKYNCNGNDPIIIGSKKLKCCVISLASYIGSAYMYSLTVDDILGSSPGKNGWSKAKG